MTSFLSRRRVRWRLALVLVSWPSGFAVAQDAAPPAGLVPFASGAVLGGWERTRRRGVTRRESDGALVSEVEVKSGPSLGVLAEGGLRFDGERLDAAAAYGAGFSVSPDTPAGPDALTQSVGARLEYILGPRWRTSASNTFYWGVLRQQQQASSLGFGGIASETPGGGGGVADPRTPASATGAGAPQGVLAPGASPLPGGATGLDGALGTSPDAGRDTSRALVQARFVRNESTAGLTYAPSPRFTHALLANATLQKYPDRAFVRSAGLRLFDTFGIGPQWSTDWTPDPFNAVRFEVSAETTFFDALFEDAETSTVAQAQSASPGEASTEVTIEPRGEATLQTGDARIVYRRALTPAWFGELGGGVGVAFPWSDPDALAAALVAQGAVGWSRDRWLVRFDVQRGASASEIGAIYALTSAQLGVEAGLTPRLRAAASAGVSRFDVLALVVRSENDLAQLAGATDGQLSLDELDRRAREVLNGWAVTAGTTATYDLTQWLAIAVAFGYEQRRSDAAERSSEDAHRATVGVTVTTDAPEDEQAQGPR